MTNDKHDIETVDNKQRGCGFLKEGTAYLRGEVAPDGVLPPFVEFETPIPWLEGHQRGYSRFPGVQFEAAVTPDPDDYHTALSLAFDRRDWWDRVTHATATRDDHEVLAAAREVAADDNVAATGWRTRVEPPLEGTRHIERLRTDALNDHPGTEGDHLGELRVARAHDLLMWVGETYYDDPGAFIAECREMGLSKAIPTSENQAPPVINPGRTRVFLIHPTAVATGTDDDGSQDPTHVPGVIGYAYVTRCLYTGIDTGDGVDFPEWAQDFAAAGRMDLVEIGDRVPAATRDNGATIAEWADDEEAPADDDEAEEP